MPKLEVVIEGLALWIDRGTYWDVLFPDCKEDKKREHQPMFSVKIGGWEVVPPENLKGQTLDLIHLVPGFAGKVSADWMLPIKRDKKNKKKKPLPHAGSGGVVASIRIPKREIAPVSRSQVGPVHFDNKTDLYLDFGTLWHAELFSPVAFLVLRERKSQQAMRTLPVDGHGTTITITVRNRTDDEHRGPSIPTELGKPIEEAKDILALASSSQGVPSYEGNTLGSGTPFAASAWPARVDPIRLCPQGYCEDCPDD